MVFRWLGSVNISGKTGRRGWIPMSGWAGSVSRPLIGQHKVSEPLIGWNWPITLPCQGGRGTWTASDTVKYFTHEIVSIMKYQFDMRKRKYWNFLSRVTFPHIWIIFSSKFLLWYFNLRDLFQLKEGKSVGKDSTWAA